jgi:hypothetical protein
MKNQIMSRKLKNSLFWSFLVAIFLVSVGLAAKSFSIKDPQLKKYVEDYEIMINSNLYALRKASTTKEKIDILKSFSESMNTNISMWSQSDIQPSSDDLRKAQNKINSLNQRMLYAIKKIELEKNNPESQNSNSTTPTYK